MSDFNSYDPAQLDAAHRHHLLLAAVAPRPIAFASTLDGEGRINLSPFSFFNVFSSNPPIMIFSPARSGRDGTLKHTHQNILEVPEVAINVVNHPMVEQMSLASTGYPKGVNEFEKAGFSMLPSDVIRPPRVKESPASFECKVREVVSLGDHGGAGNLIICEVLRLHIARKYFKDEMLDTTALDLVGRMGANWYCRASGQALFEVDKPGTSHGIGVDALPDTIRFSSILTGNQIGKLGGLSLLPDENQINNARILLAKQHLNNTADIERHAQQFIESGQISSALAILMTLQN